MSSTFTNEVHILRAELDKVKREKQAASGLISSLQRDLHSKVNYYKIIRNNLKYILLLKESNLAKLGREIDGIKIDSRDKDLRLQSLQSKVGYKVKIV